MNFGIKGEFVKDLGATTPAPADDNNPAPPAPADDNTNVNPEGENNQDPPASPAPADPPQNTFVPNDDVILSYLKEKGFNGETLDEVFKKPEPVIQTVNPYEGNNFTERDQQFIAYNKETGRGYDDFLRLQEDVDKKPALELCLERLRNESGKDYDKEVAYKHLEKKLGIDLTDPNDIDEVDLVELEIYAKQIRDQHKADQEKYNKPIEKPQPAPGEEMVQLTNGQSMPKAQYDKLVTDRENYLTAVKTSVDSVANESIKITIDDNGATKDLNVTYDYSPEDRHSMVSMASDVEGTIEKLFGTEQGIDYTRFQKALWRLDDKNWEKAISAIAHQARAEAIAEIMNEQHNTNFERNRLPGAGNHKPSAVSNLDRPGYGVKYDFSKKP